MRDWGECNDPTSGCDFGKQVKKSFGNTDLLFLMIVNCPHTHGACQ